jgi:hypothetical protein
MHFVLLYFRDVLISLKVILYFRDVFMPLKVLLYFRDVFMPLKVIALTECQIFFVIIYHYRVLSLDI